MNIFILDYDSQKSVQYYVNAHAIKMCLESAQLLCTAHHISGTNSKIIPYKATHKNHPCNIWVRKSLSNYLWLCELGLNICKEYTYRYEKIHKCESVIKWAFENKPNLPDLGLTPFALAMPQQYKTSDAVKSYRLYYINEKQHLFSWKKRPRPEWIQEANDEIECL